MVQSIDADDRFTAGGEVEPRSGDGSQGDAEELVMFLERDQLVADRRQPRGRATLSRPAKLGLWSLRIFALIVGAMVIYTFFAQL
jgi:hypothetical protein